MRHRVPEAIEERVQRNFLIKNLVFERGARMPFIELLSLYRLLRNGKTVREAMLFRSLVELVEHDDLVKRDVFIVGRILVGARPRMYREKGAVGFDTVAGLGKLGG